MNSLLVKIWFGALLSILSSFLPTWFIKDGAGIRHPQIALIAPKLATVRRHARIQKNHPSMKIALEKAPPAPAILTELHGNVIYKGLPDGTADLDIWLTTARGEELHHIKTQADGSYTLALQMDLQDREPLDWEIRAQTQDLKTRDLRGRQIMMNGKSTIDIENDVEVSAD